MYNTCAVDMDEKCMYTIGRESGRDHGRESVYVVLRHKMDGKPDENRIARFLTRFLAGVLRGVIYMGAVTWFTDYPRGCDLDVVFICICSHTSSDYVS